MNFVTDYNAVRKHVERNGLEMEWAIRVQILDKAVCVSIRANAFGKCMNPSALLRSNW